MTTTAAASACETTRSPCPVCGGSHSYGFLARKGVPVHQNLLIAEWDAAIRTRRGDLDMAACIDCGFVFNRAFDPALLAYGEDYDNTQSCSAVFDQYMDELVRHLVEEEGVRNCRIVEVGCGKGLFLRRLVGYPGSGNTGVGFDPSYVGPDRAADGRVSFRRSLYGADSASVPADVVVCRHVIEHVPQPLSLLADVRAALAGSDNPRVFFETPCVEWILENGVVWDFFYEHCSLFSASSLATAFGRAGFTVHDVRRLFGGQYLWLEASLAAAGEIGATGSAANALTPPGRPRPAESPDPTVARLAADYASRESRKTEAWRVRLDRLAADGKVAIWGAGAKGATFVNLFDPQARLVDCVVDLNPQKQGRFIPGTGHPIVRYQDLASRGVRNAILMNPNYREENLALLKTAGIAANLLDWD
jgi:hypothetical protein